MERIDRSGLQVAQTLNDFVEREALPGTGIKAETFWAGLAGIIADLGPRNRELLQTRDRLQAEIDAYHRQHAGQPVDAAPYQRLLRDIGYLLPEPADFAIATDRVDDEIARVAGPQLVVPVSNARYALNAANARWGGVYDALPTHRRYP
jgi:malate synthase